MGKLWRVAVLAVLLGLLQSAPALATFPGLNGSLLSTAPTFTSGGRCLVLIDPSSGAQTQPGACANYDYRISPDGKRVSGADVDGVPHVQNLDGNNLLTYNGDGDSPGTAWSYDGGFVSMQFAGFDTGTLVYYRPDDPDLEMFLGPGWGPGGFNDTSTSWSRFGRIAHFYFEGDQDPPGPSYFESVVPGGCCRTTAPNSPGTGLDWSPVEVRFAVNDQHSQIVEYNPDLTGAEVLASGPDVGSGAPHYSPDGSKILFGAGEIWSMNLDGSGKTNLTNTAASDVNPIWSPDSQKIAFLSNRDGDYDIYVMNRDGSNVVQLTNGAATEPLYDWQPVLKGYPRPKGAGTLYAPLVPAYTPCASPNRQHAAPLSFASCNPPTQTSTQLTVGTPDANLKPANSVASLRIGVIPGAAGPPDDAEVNLITSITDVRNASDLSDYTGNLEMRVPLRITDKSNTPYPGGPGPGTVQDFTFTWSVPCTATGDPNIGSTCALQTTADTLLPGTAVEGRRAIWQTDQIEVRDSNGYPFLRQGVFVP